MPAPTNIPVLIAFNTFTPPPGVPLGDQTLHRGGLDYVGDADANCGGGPVYVATCSGSRIAFDKNGSGKEIPAKPDGTPADPTPAMFIRFGPEGWSIEPGYDWIHDSGDPGAPGFPLTIRTTNGVPVS